MTTLDALEDKWGVSQMERNEGRDSRQKEFVLWDCKEGRKDVSLDKQG